MLQRLTDFLLKPFRSLTGGEIHPSNSLAVAHAFVQDFQLTYAQEDDTEADLPPFLPTKWDDVLRTSKTDGKFVLVYLHSNYHQHSQMFCEEALKDAGVLEFMHSGELLVWGANVSHRDGSEVAGYLKACSYPFMAVCMKHQSGALLVLDRVEGISSLGNDGSTTLGGKLLARLKDVVTRNQQVVSQVQAVNRAETERRTFRQQQDQEYENTLRADRERVRCVRLCSCVFVCVRVCSCVFVCVHVKSMDILCWW
jgi:FAS-associated factor 2